MEVLEKKYQSFDEIINEYTTYPITGRKTRSISDLSCAPRFEVVRLKDENGNLIDYEETDSTKAIRKRIDEWNGFADSHWIDLFLSDDEWITLKKEMNKPRYNRFNERVSYKERKLDLRHKQVYRVFNDGSFALGGRWYGPWWQAVLKEYRKRYITVNGTPTVELDFSCLHPAMLYAMEGVQFAGDAYRIEGIENTESNRGLIKATLHKLVNALPSQRIRAPRRDARPDGWDWKGLQAAIIERHQPIAHHFRSGIGSRLQRIDSDIAETVMMTMMREGILVLPVHDSFIVRREERDRLEALMKDAYRQRMGFEIGVKTERSFVDDLPDSALVDGVEGYMERMVQTGAYEGYRARREAFEARQ